MVSLCFNMQASDKIVARSLAFFQKSSQLLPESHSAPDVRDSVTSSMQYSIASSARASTQIMGDTITEEGSVVSEGSHVTGK